MTKFISHTNLKSLLEELQNIYSVYVPIKKGTQRFYTRFSSSADTMEIGEVRAFEPLKSFFTRARKKVAEGFSASVPQVTEKPAAIVGVKACDLKGFKIQDHVFNNPDDPDPIYRKAREDNLIISADCTCAINTCFCLAANGKPYPEKDFDINLSATGDGYYVEEGSEKGKKIIQQNASLFKESRKEHIDRRDEQRKNVAREVENNIKEHSVPTQEQLKGAITKKYESPLWEEEAKNCVECGACNTICPTCHCFLLYDQKDEKKMTRFSVWDSCMIKDFARVAGGANPRKKLWMRLRNRFEKKFDFFPKVANVYACTGCGRCISACPAKIDIRNVLQKLVSNG